ncbi:dTDP-glucose 4,6-dehydratase [Naumannella halotolerans]|uniref:dTDP-glucose 4,6-dehydratase n=1 Tax=Naumannella halotolerans TaxID=993414 RepID=A0A4R7IZ30_9ACTN|nr:dTDP-glucose 4,6-dehydratase [Naumannella halotolerans]TDT29964.1 dTDP-glucose 4,6-dehydratase [Naumannella halotolerans]
MKFLITGGLGFIGSNLVHHVIRMTDHSVTILDKGGYASRRESLQGLPVERAQVVIGDICDAGVIDPLVEDCDAIIHCAAESHNDNSIAGPAEFVRSNVIGTFEVLEAVRRHKVRLHHISTDEVYGDLELDDPNRFTPETPYNPSSPYSSTKAASDHLVRAWIRTYGVEATLSNCSNNYGPRQHVEKFIPRQITNLIDGVRPRLYGTGQNVRDWIHVDDHNSAVMAILDRGRIGDTYLIGAEGERSNLDVVKDLLRIFGRPDDDFDHVNDRPGHDLRYAIDPSKLTSELGWAPKHISFAEGLAATVEWYRDNEEWWRGSKAETEAKYSKVGQ